MTSRDTRPDDRGPDGSPAPRSPLSPAAEASAAPTGTVRTPRDEHDGRDQHDQHDGHAHDTGRKSRKKALPLWQEVIVLLGLALVLAVVVKALFVQAFFVPSGSMEPQFVQGDRILVEKVSYWDGDIKRGDVIVFDDPGGWLNATDSREASGIVQQGLEAVGLYPTGGHLVKRVIGLGGDRVACCDKDGRVTVNGVALQERAYLKSGVAPSEQTFDVKVPDGALWVMGDNRLQSGDSRVHIGGPGGGFVPADDVVGKVWAIVWPLDRTEILDRPEIFNDQALDAS